MKTTKLLTILILALMVCQARLSKAEPMGTGFTYQGRLIDADTAADGLYDFQFKLFDDPNAGSQKGDDVNVADVDVIDGYFTAELDFGSEFFDGNDRWLEILVRPGDSNDPNAFVTLSPRQQITATPYALQTRGIFVDDRMNIGMGTTSPKGKLHVDGGKAEDDTDASDITFKAQYGGDAVRGLIGRRGGDIILLPGEAGESKPLSPPGPSGKVGIGTAAPEAMLDVRGDIKVDQKIQAYDSGGLELATDEGTTRIFVADGGNVGIGTTNPLWELEVANPMPGNAAESAVTADDAGGAIAAYSSTFSTFPHLADRVSVFSNLATATGLDLRADGGTSDIRFYTGGITPSNERIRITPSGNVGIGTTNPGAKLEVKQNDWKDIVKVGTPDTSNRLILSSGPDYASISGGQTNQDSIVISHSTGNVGIGHSLSLPQAKLQVNGDLKVKGDVTVDGAYVGSFPRPAYDTGWVTLLQGQTLICNHNLGGNVDNYVVDLTFKDEWFGSINNCAIGGDKYNWGEQWITSGAYWSELTTSSIKVYRNDIDQNAKQVRIRIWVYK